MAQLTIGSLKEYLDNFTDDTVILLDANEDGYVDADHMFMEIVKDLGDEYEKVHGITKGRYKMLSLKGLQASDNLNKEEQNIGTESVIIITRKKDFDMDSLMSKIDDMKPIKLQ